MISLFSCRKEGGEGGREGGRRESMQGVSEQMSGRRSMPCFTY